MHANVMDNILPRPLKRGLWAALRDASEIRGMLCAGYMVQCQLWFCRPFWKKKNSIQPVNILKLPLIYQHQTVKSGV